MSERRNTAEDRRLAEDRDRRANWKRWGPYLSERQWGTVREDYSPNGDSWGSFTHDMARSRAYRWGEDGLLGITDRQCRLCFALAMWNGRDPILKERLFGLTGPEGNHGEDVKELYYYLDSTPTHSYMKGLYKYPQTEFPYERLIETNRSLPKSAPEHELADTGAFDENRYWDVQVEYAKAAEEDILIVVSATNRGPDRARLRLLPTLWFRNTWIWGCRHEGCWMKPRIDVAEDGGLRTEHVALDAMRLFAEPLDGHAPKWIFTENETNTRRLFGHDNYTRFVKDAFHEFVVRGGSDAVNPAERGTKAAAIYDFEAASGETKVVRLRLSLEAGAPTEPFGESFDSALDARRREADEFYAERTPPGATEEEARVLRQSYAGLLWTKQFYHYIVEDWLEGDPEQLPPPESRRLGRNNDWTHLYNRDVVSMPDKWEYPWYAAWDLAFHTIPFARVDSTFAKEQLMLFLREWYMHPNGQIPAYEYNFSDVNPPVHAWACWRVYKMSAPRGKRDTMFLKRTFQKLLINFTWWVNRKDPSGRNLFSGGFLGLDNIGVFDRSAPLPTGGTLEQADATAWMAFYCLTMLEMALTLASEDPSYEDLASKFFEHFVSIADAMNTLGGTGLWDEDDGFYYDQIRFHDRSTPLKVRSMVGLIPLIAVGSIEEENLVRHLPGFKKRMDWFLEYRADLAGHINYMSKDHAGDRPYSLRLLSIPSRERLARVLRYMLDENEFLSPHGIRSMSRRHLDEPYIFRDGDREQKVSYVPGDSDSWLFGGNSNWRGPIWFPVNFLLVEALERYHYFYGDTFKVECPTGSGRMMNLQQVAREISGRLASIFLPDENGRRPVNGNDPRYAKDPAWKDLILFHEYFHGDDGRGLGASHQTGWTALVSQCVEDRVAGRTEPRGGSA